MRFKAWPVVSLLAAFTAALVPACGGGGGSRSPAGPAPAPPAPTPAPTPTPEPIAFGPGQHRIGTTIQPGRYFANPPRGGCYWERQSGLGGTLDEIIANDVFIFDPPQVIVDILGSDVAFEGDGDCGSWYATRRQPAQVNIPPGVWLVGAQITPGVYQANVGAGCYWERNSNFEGVLDSIIANDFIPDASARLVEISAGDVGFYNDADCGTWTRATGNVEVRVQSASEIARARQQARAKRGLR
jgi:hypothetical protein